ncbi:hypothetical protein D3C76_218350 [compost metagenome]
MRGYASIVQGRRDLVGQALGGVGGGGDVAPGIGGGGYAVERRLVGEALSQRGRAGTRLANLFDGLDVMGAALVRPGAGRIVVGVIDTVAFR